MATLKTYVRSLWSAEKTIYSKLSGDVQDLRTTPYFVRLTILTLNVVISVLIKALTDKALLTDLELNTALSNATGAVFPIQPEAVPVEDEDMGTHPIDPDLGV